ncbi:MAG TPA: homoserine kinase, partial [Myxococcota bacterium]
DNTKWEAKTLVAAFDWEMAGRDHLVLDIAVCVHAWCWRSDERAYDADRCQALVAGYQSVRPLSPTEKRGLFVEAVFAAVRFTASRVRDFEVPRAGAPERSYLDYRDFAARLDAIEALGPKPFRRLVGIA